jgi:hypothetical protein
MVKAMEYKVVWETSITGLTMKVNKLLGEGWTLQGGVSISVSTPTSGSMFAQAMIKE